MAMHFRTGRADRAIVELAREIGADVIVVATQRASALQRLLLGGTVADRIARAAPCPVFVVRPKDEEGDELTISERAPRR
jgi:nucleotide-binding universal stress UspA family protein